MYLFLALVKISSPTVIIYVGTVRLENLHLASSELSVNLRCNADTVAKIRERPNA